MINPFEYKEVPSSVKNEIGLRRASPSYGTINLIGGKVGFRLTSMCSECDSKYQLRHDNNYHPNPTVSGIEVKKQGELEFLITIGWDPGMPKTRFVHVAKNKLPGDGSEVSRYIKSEVLFDGRLSLFTDYKF